MKVYFDANVIIYAAEGIGEKAAVGHRLLDLADERKISAVTSELTMAEVTAPSQRSGAATVARKIDAYTDLLIKSGIFTLVEIDMEILLQTSWLRDKRQGLRLIDAIHLATATETGCEFMITNDRRIRSSPELTIVAPTESGLEQLLGETR